MLENFKKNVAQIHWPTKSAILKRTCICVVTAAVLSTVIAGWTTCIEYVVNWVLSLF